LGAKLRNKKTKPAALPLFVCPDEASSGSTT
jgi:hypothetical protein